MFEYILIAISVKIFRCPAPHLSFGNYLDINVTGCAPDCDLDNDGIADFWPRNPQITIDNCLGLANPHQGDYDGDGVGDWCDNCPFVANPDQNETVCEGINYGPDSDGDGIPDALDNCVNISNPAQQDRDIDSIGNACDSDIDGDTRNNNIDTNDDGDFFSDGDDLCDSDFNFNIVDYDNDGVGDFVVSYYRGLDTDFYSGFPDYIPDVGYFYVDGCDNCWGVPNPDQMDTDGDGLGDACDNCPLVGNIDQSDADNDTIGDACDICPFVANMDQDGTDSDGDTIPNACDNCPEIPNLDQADADENGIGDLCDVTTSNPSSNPTSNPVAPFRSCECSGNKKVMQSFTLTYTGNVAVTVDITEFEKKYGDILASFDVSTEGEEITLDIDDVDGYSSFKTWTGVIVRSGDDGGSVLCKGRFKKCRADWIAQQLVQGCEQYLDFTSFISGDGALCDIVAAEMDVMDESGDSSDGGNALIVDEESLQSDPFKVSKNESNGKDGYIKFLWIGIGIFLVLMALIVIARFIYIVIGRKKKANNEIQVEMANVVEMNDIDGELPKTETINV